MDISDQDHRKIVDWAKQHPEIRQIYLYGSRARGDNRPDNDIDLAIELNRQVGDEYTYVTWVFIDMRFGQSAYRQILLPSVLDVLEFCFHLLPKKFQSGDFQSKAFHPSLTKIFFEHHCQSHC